MDVRTICLGLLTKEDRSGYEIKKLLEEGPLANFVEASFGSIYPALTKMTEEGLVEFRTETQEGRPDKKTYSITPRGRDVFRTALEGDIAPDRYRSDFLFVLMFSDELAPDRIRQLIDERIAYYDSQIARIKRELGDEKKPGACFIAGEAITIFEAAKKYLETNRHLVESGKDITQHADTYAATAD